ncbi:MAG TPA: alpha/beta hydrolase [Streptosporangiaceae bacterium]
MLYGQVAGHRPALAEVEDIALIDFDLATVAGDGRRHSRLYLHGFGGDKRQLRPLGESLDAPAVTSMYASLRAHGASFKPAWGYSVLDFAADVHRVADVLPGPIDFIGYSYGALVAAACALTWAADRTRSLVVIDQSFDADPARHVADEWAEGSYLRWTYGYGGMLERLAAPTLLLTAADSAMVSAAELARLRGRCGTRLTAGLIAGAHDTCLNDPGGVAREISRFYAAHFG